MFFGSREYAIGLVLLCTVGITQPDCVGESTDGQEPFIDWETLQNPVYDQQQVTGDFWSTKDACMIYKDGAFYLFFSAFFEADGRVRSHVVGVRTDDFKTFSEPMFLWDGRDDGWIGMCSPEIHKHEGIYYLTYNSWGDKDGRPNQLFYATSTDLEMWDKHKPLARSATVDENGNPVRAIDAALAFHNGRVYLSWKERQTPMFAVADRIDAAEWTRLGSPDPGWYENAKFLMIDGHWHMLATARGPEPKRDHLPNLTRLRGTGDEDSDWLDWEPFRTLEIPYEGFNTDNRANAAFLADWRDHDGYFYLLYAGRTQGQTHAGRGDNRLGLARSTDLMEWVVPGGP